MSKTMESINLSLPQSRNVRGYEISRAPLGAFLQAIKQLQDFPELLMRSLFPDMNLQEILLALKTSDADFLGQAFVRILSIAPEQALRLIARLTGVPENKLKSDPDIGVDGLMDIVVAWYEVNQIENFMRAARSLWTRTKALAGKEVKPGSNA